MKKNPRTLDLKITSGYDQNIISRDAEWLVNRMDEIIAESVAKHDVEIAVNALAEIQLIASLSGLALARGIYKLGQYWESFGIQDTYIDYIFGRIGLSHYTIDRYMKVWKMFDTKQVPEEYVPEIQAINIRDLVPIATAVEQGLEMSNADWRRIAHAPDGVTVHEIIRDLKHLPPRSNAIRLIMDRDGQITMLREGFSPRYIGTLDVDSDDEYAQKAISRIINNSGISRR